MVLHVAVIQVVELHKTDAQRLIAKLVAANDLTARLYYRVTPSAWEDAIFVCEGEGQQVDRFIEALREQSEVSEETVAGVAGPAQQSPLIRGIFLLARQWTYSLFSAAANCEDSSEAADEAAARVGGQPDLPESPGKRPRCRGECAATSEAGAEADARSEAATAEGRAMDPEPTGAAWAHRHVGPPGLRGAEYHDIKDLASKRLAKLELGCNWDELLMAAQLNAVISNRKEPQEQSTRIKRKTKRGSNQAVPTKLVGHRMEQLQLREERTSTSRFSKRL